MIKKTYTFKTQGSLKLGDLRDFLQETEVIPGNTTVSITKYEGNQFDPGSITIAVTEP